MPEAADLGQHRDVVPDLGRRREVSLPQGVVSLAERGEGEPLLFVHGLLVDGRLWRKVVPRLSGDVRCLVPDLPLGSHRTPLRRDADLSPGGLARLIVDLLDALGLERVTLVGNDTGGALCQLVATTYPDRVERLVLTPCDAFENFPPKAFRPLVKAASVPGALRAILEATKLPGVASSPAGFGWLAKHGIPAQLTGDWMAPALADAAVRRDLAKAMREITPAITLDAAARLAAFRAPALLAWAREDRFFPFEHAERLAAILPDSRLVAIEDSYSFVPEDQPEALADAIRAFVAEYQAAAA
jgi:pimeloyl-ACP methyl ester carboxylesterase